MPPAVDGDTQELLDYCDELVHRISVREVFSPLLYRISIALATAPDPHDCCNPYNCGLYLLMTGPSFHARRPSGPVVTLPSLSLEPGTVGMAKGVAVARFFSTYMQELADMDDGWEDYVTKITQHLASFDARRRHDFQHQHVQVPRGCVTVNLAFRMASHMLDCGWIKCLGWLFLQLLPLVLERTGVY